MERELKKKGREDDVFRQLVKDNHSLIHASLSIYETNSYTPPHGIVLHKRGCDRTTKLPKNNKNGKKTRGKLIGNMKEQLSLGISLQKLPAMQDKVRY